MLLQKLIPCVFAASAALAVLPSSTVAQTAENRARQIAQTIETGETVDASTLENEALIVSVPLSEEFKAARVFRSQPGFKLQFEQLISSAIDARLGAPYSWGATGPSAFDCSGFVWSTFRSAGIDFERASARTLWARFAAPAPEEQFKFGTLVFFSGLAHVGIVADEHGFYHASRHHGVVYSPFNDYWSARIDGFRRVPLTQTSSTAD